MSPISKNFKRTKFACYYTNISNSAAFALPPLLFVTFRQMYGISYTLLGTLVLINFCTQLIVDLIFTFFSKYFNVHKTIQAMPLIMTVGLSVYALVPLFFPKIAYLGLVLGTVLFSISAGLCEVLISPLVAAIPSETPEKDMSILHSLYAYGVLAVVTVSSIFLKLFGTENWMYLTLFWAFLPIISSLLFVFSPMPQMDITTSAEGKTKKNRGIYLCVLCIFLGGAAENAMTNWISGYMETALQVPKMLGDILGMASFAVLLGLGRTFYAKYGKNISKILLLSMIGASLCYLTVSFCPNVIISMIACILTGLFTSMLWPGTLILMEEKFQNPPVAAYALMAAGGDLGGSVAPQLLGVVTDSISQSGWAESLSQSLSVTAEQIGLKTGMLTASIFPILGIFLLLYMKKYFAKK